MRKLYKTTFVVEVLSDVKVEDYELSYLLDADTSDLRVSTDIKDSQQEVVSPELMRTLLREHRSDPNLFGGEE